MHEKHVYFYLSAITASAVHTLLMYCIADFITLLKFSQIHLLVFLFNGTRNGLRNVILILDSELIHFGNFLIYAGRVNIRHNVHI